MTLRLTPARKWLLLALGAALLAYASNVLRGTFVWDDDFIVSDWMRPLTSPLKIFFPPEVLTRSSFYKPVANLVSWVLFLVAGKNVVIWKLGSLAFHLGAVAGVFAVIRRWLVPRERTGDWRTDPDVRAGVGALLFAVWPAGSSGVVWIAARGDPQMACFLLWALFLHLRARDHGASALGAAFLWLAALLSKEPAVGFLPGAIAATILVPPGADARVRGRKAWTASALWLPYVLAFVFYVALRRWAMGPSAGLAGEAAQAFHGLETLKAAFFAWGFYVKEMFLLGRGSPYVEQIPADTVTALFSLAGMALVGAALLVKTREGHRGYAFAAIWSVLFLGPALAVAADPPGVNPLADRYLYLSVSGLAFSVAMALPRLPAVSPRVAAAATAVAALACAALVSVRAEPWMTDEKLWERAWRDEPGSLLAALNKGSMADRRGNLEEAESWYRIAAWKGRYSRGEKRHLAFVALASVYARTGRLEEAQFTLAEASRFALTSASFGRHMTATGQVPLIAALTRGDKSVTLQRKDVRASLAAFEQAVRVDPSDSEPRVMLGILYESLGDLVAARESWARMTQVPGLDARHAELARLQVDRLDRKIAAEPDPVRRHWLRARTHELAERWDEAADEYRAGLELAPGRVDLLTGLADALYRGGRPDLAAAELEAAGDAIADSADAWLNLGVYRTALRRYPEAADAFARAMQIAPEWPKPVVLEARLREELGQREAAIAGYERFLRLEGSDPALLFEVEQRLRRLRAAGS